MSLKRESVGSEVRNCVFYLSVFSKNVRNLDTRDKQTQTLMTNGARDSTFNAKIHHSPLSYKPIQINHVKEYQRNYYISGTEVTQSDFHLHSYQKQRVHTLEFRC